MAKALTFPLSKTGEMLRHLGPESEQIPDVQDFVFCTVALMNRESISGRDWTEDCPLSDRHAHQCP